MRAGCRGGLCVRRLKWQETSGNCIISSFIFCTSEQVLVGWQNLSVQGMWHVRGEFVNVYRVMVRKKTHGRPSGRWETILK